MVVPISAAMVMPGDRIGADADLAGDAGRDHHEEEPEDDDENGAEQVDARAAAATVSRSASATAPTSVTQIGRSMSVRSREPISPTLPRRSWKPERKAETIVGQRAEQGDDAGRGHGAGADVEDEVGPDLARAHVGDELGLGEDRLGEAGAEQLDGGDQHQVGEASRRRRDSPAIRGPDDVAHAQQLGRDLGGDRGALVAGGDPARDTPSTP